VTDTFDPHVTIGDLRQLYCVKGAHKAFRAANLDFSSFLRNGALASELRGHGYDAVIDRVVEHIRQQGRI
jgi:hypothetical protein